MLENMSDFGALSLKKFLKMPQNMKTCFKELFTFFFWGCDVFVFSRGVPIPNFLPIPMPILRKIPIPMPIFKKLPILTDADTD